MTFPSCNSGSPRARPVVFMRTTAMVAALALLVFTAPEAGANDGWYSIDPAGLNLSKAKGISILSEKLAISFTGVKVVYEFTNIDKTAKTGVIGFPIPHPGLLDTDSDGPGPEGIANILKNFTIKVNGEPVTPKGMDYAVKAMASPAGASGAAEGEQDAAALPPVDITGILRKEGIRLDDLKASIVKQLEDGPLRDKVLAALPEAYREGFPYYLRGWVIPWWEQSFGPEEVITVEHSYQPIPGGYLFTGYDIWDKDGEFVLPEQEIAQTRDHVASERARLIGDLKEAYGEDAEISCSLDPDSLPKMIEAKLRANYKKPPAEKAEEVPAIAQIFSFVSYVLETAKSWTGPIGNFEMTVTGDGKPVLFCFPAPIELVDAESFTYRTQLYDFRPEMDLAITRVD